MGLGPGYGETPLEGEELDALDPALISLFGTAATKSEIFDLEAALQAEVRDRLGPHRQRRSHFGRDPPRRFHRFTPPHSLRRNMDLGRFISPHWTKHRSGSVPDHYRAFYISGDTALPMV